MGNSKGQHRWTGAVRRANGTAASCGSRSRTGQPLGPSQAEKNVAVPILFLNRFAVQLFKHVSQANANLSFHCLNRIMGQGLLGEAIRSVSHLDLAPHAKKLFPVLSFSFFILKASSSC